MATVDDKGDIISQICRCQTRQQLVHQACDLVVDSLPHRKPVQLAQHMRDVITSSGAGDELCGCVLDRLKLPHEAVRHTIQRVNGKHTDGRPINIMPSPPSVFMGQMTQPTASKH